MSSPSRGCSCPVMLCRRLFGRVGVGGSQAKWLRSRTRSGTKPRRPRSAGWVARQSVCCCTEGVTSWAHWEAVERMRRAGQRVDPAPAAPLNLPLLGDRLLLTRPYSRCQAKSPALTLCSQSCLRPARNRKSRREVSRVADFSPSGGLAGPLNCCHDSSSPERVPAIAYNSASSMLYPERPACVHRLFRPLFRLGRACSALAADSLGYVLNRSCLALRRSARRPLRLQRARVRSRSPGWNRRPVHPARGRPADPRSSPSGCLRPCRLHLCFSVSCFP